METGDSITRSEIRDFTADGVDYACNIVALVESRNYFRQLLLLERITNAKLTSLGNCPVFRIRSGYYNFDEEMFRAWNGRDIHVFNLDRRPGEYECFLHVEIGITIGK
jgi:hypothetical protein